MPSLRLGNYPKYLLYVGAQDLSNEGMITAPKIRLSALKGLEPHITASNGQVTQSSYRRLGAIEGMKETLGGETIHI